MDTTKFKNGKYFLGDYKEPNDYKGWFVGAFIKDDDPCKTEKLEVVYREHDQGDKTEPHYHKKKIELLVMLEGKARYQVNGNEVILESGKYLFIDVNNVIESEFLEKSKVFAIHAPSIPTDKYLVE